MASPSPPIAEGSTPSIHDLRAVGFTEGQAAAIKAAVEATTGDAVDAVRDDLMRWHLYIALYLLAQVSVALLACLMLQNLRDRPNLLSVSYGDASAQATRVWDDVSLLLTYHWPSADRASLRREEGLQYNLETFAPASRTDHEISVSPETRRGAVYQDSTGGWRAIDSDSTPVDHAHTSESAATSERHHAPRLVCRRQRLESECVLIRPLERCLSFRPQREFARSGEIVPTTRLPEWRLP